MTTETLADLIIRAHKLLDPAHQSHVWPDPIAWDGRPLTEQACDLRSLLDVKDDECDSHKNPYRELIDLLGTALVNDSSY